MALSAEQIDEFREKGFVNAGRLFTGDELEIIGREYDRLVTFEAQTLGNEKDGVYPYRAMLNFRSPPLAKILTHPAMLEIARQLIGPDVRFFWDQGINKAPGSGSPIPWHQDNGYHPGGCPEFLTTWLALDDSRLENGGLQVLPGSHKAGHREHALDTVHYYVPDVDARDAVELPARAGDTLVFSTLLLHQTVGNRTRHRQRRAWVIQYGPADAKNFTTDEPYDDRPWVLRDGAPVEPPYSERRFQLS